MPGSRAQASRARPALADGYAGERDGRAGQVRQDIELDSGDESLHPLAAAVLVVVLEGLAARLERLDDQPDRAGQEHLAVRAGVDGQRGRLEDAVGERPGPQLNVVRPVVVDRDYEALDMERDLRRHGLRVRAGEAGPADGRLR